MWPLVSCSGGGRRPAACPFAPATKPAHGALAPALAPRSPADSEALAAAAPPHPLHPKTLAFGSVSPSAIWQEALDSGLARSDFLEAGVGELLHSSGSGAPRVAPAWPLPSMISAVVTSPGKKSLNGEPSNADSLREVALSGRRRFSPASRHANADRTPTHAAPPHRPRIEPGRGRRHPRNVARRRTP